MGSELGIVWMLETTDFFGSTEDARKFAFRGTSVEPYGSFGFSFSPMASVEVRPPPPPPLPPPPSPAAALAAAAIALSAATATAKGAGLANLVAALLQLGARVANLVYDHFIYLGLLNLLFGQLQAKPLRHLSQVSEYK